MRINMINDDDDDTSDKVRYSYERAISVTRNRI